MTPADDFPYEMDRFPVFPFDERDANVVFGASSASQPVPEDLDDIAELVHAARRPGSVDELAGEDVITAQIAASIREHAAPPLGDADERIRVLRKFRTAKVAAVSTAVLVLGGTAAAAATCNLPAPVQSSVARSLSDVGINIPVHHQAELAVKHAVRSANVGPTVKARHHEQPEHAPGAFGTVASVNGVSDPGTCGGSVPTGSFALTGPKRKTFTVNVSLSTGYVDKGVTTPTFANVCVGDVAAAKGTVAGTTVTSDKVFVAPPPPPHVPKGAVGIVASVNGVGDPGTCGKTGLAGSFTLTARKNMTFTVNVDVSTPFADPAVTAPSFANVCVGALVHAKGTVVDTTVTATNVFIVPAPKPPEHGHGHEHKHGVFGSVVSVNGVTTAGTCGASVMPSSFTLTGPKGNTFTVNVDSNTKFGGFGVTAPSFASVCVGVKAAAVGDATGATIAAAGVFVFPAGAGDHDGFDRHKGGHFPKVDAGEKAHTGSGAAPQHHATTDALVKGGSGHPGPARHHARHGR